jgi:hypothetical protein
VSAPVQISLGWGDVGENIVLVGAVLAAIAYIVATTWRWIRKIKGVFDRLEKVVTNVEAQLYPNGGHSLRDAVDRIQDHLGIIDLPPKKEPS